MFIFNYLCFKFRFKKFYKLLKSVRVSENARKVQKRKIMTILSFRENPILKIGAPQYFDLILLQNAFYVVRFFNHRVKFREIPLNQMRPHRTQYMYVFVQDIQNIVAVLFKNRNPCIWI